MSVHKPAGISNRVPGANTDTLAAALEALLAPVLGPPERAHSRSGAVRNLTRLSGGANMETWAFDYWQEHRARPLILRRRPAGIARHPAPQLGIPLATEAALLGLARRAGAPVPLVLARSEVRLSEAEQGTPAPALQTALPCADPESALGDAMVMSRLDGEALPQRILRDAGFAQARERLAFQCGEALARIHAIPLESLPPGLRDLEWQADLDRLQGLCDHFGNVSPVQQLVLNWLRIQPAPQSPRVLCHGDFRLGNLLVNESGLTAVLDWELAHVGFAGEDLGYLCANVWRFDGPGPVGGFGEYRQLLDGYRSVHGHAPTLAELLLWQLYAALGWGLVCLTMLELHSSGADPGLERAAVGRRFSESEVDMLLLLETLE